MLSKTWKEVLGTVEPLILVLLECSGRDKDLQKLCSCLQLHLVAQKFAPGDVCHLLPLRTFGKVFADAFQPHPSEDLSQTYHQYPCEQQN